jgi:hypothetical protein
MSNLTDYVARNFGISFAQDIMPAGVRVSVTALDFAQMFYETAKQLPTIHVVSLWLARRGF